MGILGLHHIHLRVPDIAASRAFCADFGLSEVPAPGDAERVYLRGAGAHSYQVVLEPSGASHLQALAFDVDGPEDLDRAVAEHGGVRSALPGPGGGEAVRLVDPEGNDILLVHGIGRRDPDSLGPALLYNQGPDKARWGTPQHSAELGPPTLLRLGHVGMFVRDMKACDAWYRGVLGLLPSDVMWAGSPHNPIAGFYRIDRGDEWVDHHTVALFGLGKSDLHHASFEVQTSQAQFVAHRWLRRQGHEHLWGVGRHPKGSHVFDVWRDPSGYRFETFSDTDVLNASSPPDVFDMTTTEMDLWVDRDAMEYFA